MPVKCSPTTIEAVQLLGARVRLARKERVCDLARSAACQGQDAAERQYFLENHVDSGD